MYYRPFEFRHFRKPRYADLNIRLLLSSSLFSLLVYIIIYNIDPYLFSYGDIGVSDIVASSGVRLCNIAIYSIILVIGITTDYKGENRQSALTSCPTRSDCYNIVHYTSNTQFLYDLDIQISLLLFV